MKIASLYCSKCCCEVPLDHYGTMDAPGECPDPPMPIPGIMAILEGELGDEAHANNNITATRLFDCPRKSAIQDNHASKAVNLETFNAPSLWGNAMHEKLRRHTPKYMMPEVKVEGVMFKGTEFEIFVKGTADLIVPGIALLDDYKTHNLFTQQRLCKTPNTNKLEYDIQISVYKRLSPVPIEAGGVWNGAMPAKMSGLRPWLRVPVRFMTEAEILAAKPFEGSYTVADMILMRKRFIADLAAGVPVLQAINKLPLVGADQASWVCEYCSVEAPCMALAKGRPV